jgi:hypothetical protein
MATLIPVAEYLLPQQLRLDFDAALSPLALSDRQHALSGSIAAIGGESLVIEDVEKPGLDPIDGRFVLGLLASLRRCGLVNGVRRLFTDWYGVDEAETGLGEQRGILRPRAFLSTAHHEHFDVGVKHALRHLSVLAKGALNDK